MIPRYGYFPVCSLSQEIAEASRRQEEDRQGQGDVSPVQQHRQVPAAERRQSLQPRVRDVLVLSQSVLRWNAKGRDAPNRAEAAAYAVEHNLKDYL